MLFLPPSAPDSKDMSPLRFHCGIQSASRRQPVVTKSTMAAEYVAASQATDELMRVAKLVGDLGLPGTPALLRQDNQSTAHTLNNPIEDGKTKYLQIQTHYVRERSARRGDRGRARTCTV